MRMLCHDSKASHVLLYTHTLLRMTQELGLDGVIRQRIRGLRLARGWSLDALAARCFLSPSTLSRIETGHRRIALDQLVPIARALGTTLDQLVESVDDEDVVIRPMPEHTRGLTTWLLSRERALHGATVAKMRITPNGRPARSTSVCTPVTSGSPSCRGRPACNWGSGPS